MFEGTFTIAGLINEVFAQYRELYEDDEMARIATAATVNGILIDMSSVEEDVELDDEGDVLYADNQIGAAAV